MAEKKGSSVGAPYDVRAAFEMLPVITGMELVRRGEQWQGRYYITGERHPWRRDKLKFYKLSGCIWVTEEGGQTLSVTNWLQQYGGASDYWDAVHILKGAAGEVDFSKVVSRKEKDVVRYVDREVVDAAKQWDLRKCPLFVWMCGLFGEDKVKEAWDKYNVSTDSKGYAVFWFVDAEGKVCHDKRMKYREDGHRDKTFGGTREFTTADGYRGRCFFGAHLVGEGSVVRVVESEKSALLGYLAYGEVFVSCGGKNGLREADDRMELYPDMDAIEEWSNKGGKVVEWWNGKEVGEHWDIGDLIVKEMGGVL